MEKNLFLDNAAPLPEDFGQRNLQSSSTNSFPIDKDCLVEKIKTDQSCFVVRLSRSERKNIESLNRDFGESFMTIVAKSFRLYRTIAEATNNGGSLVMSTRSIHAPGGGELASPSNQSLCGSRGDTASDGFTIEEVKTIPIAGIRPKPSIDIQESIIAVRDQFADNGLAPITLNPLYIHPAKGAKTDKISLKVEGEFAAKLESLVQKTGLKKSTIIRDSILLYNFVKRKFCEQGVTFYIGGTPIVAI